MAMAKTMAGTAGISGLAVLFASLLRVGATVATAHRLKVPGAAATNKCPAVEDDERYGDPYHGHTGMMAEKASLSNTDHITTSRAATEMLELPVAWMHSYPLRLFN